MVTTDELNQLEIERLKQRWAQRVSPKDQDHSPTLPEPLDPRRGEEPIGDNE